MIKFFFGVVIGVSLAVLYHVIYLWRDPNLEIAQKQTRTYQTAVMEAEDIIEQNITTTENLVKEWQTKYNTLCKKLKTNDCEVPVKASYPRYFYGENGWLIQTGNAWLPVD